MLWKTKQNRSVKDDLGEERRSEIREPDQSQAMGGILDYVKRFGFFARCDGKPLQGLQHRNDIAGLYLK